MQEHNTLFAFGLAMVACLSTGIGSFIKSVSFYTDIVGKKKSRIKQEK